MFYSFIRGNSNVDPLVAHRCLHMRSAASPHLTHPTCSVKHEQVTPLRLRSHYFRQITCPLRMTKTPLNIYNIGKENVGLQTITNQILLHKPNSVGVFPGTWSHSNEPHNMPLDLVYWVRSNSYGNYLHIYKLLHCKSSDSMGLVIVLPKCCTVSQNYLATLRTATAIYNVHFIYSQWILYSRTVTESTFTQKIIKKVKVVLHWSICNADSQRMFFARNCRHVTLVASCWIAFKNLQRVAALQIAQNVIRNWVLNLNSFSRNTISLQIGVANDQCNATFMQAGHYIIIVVLVLMVGEPTSNIVMTSCHSSHCGATGFAYVKWSTFVTFHQRGRATADRKPRTRHIWIGEIPPGGPHQCRREVCKSCQGLSRQNFRLCHICPQRRNPPCQRLVRKRSY